MLRAYVYSEKGEAKLFTDRKQAVNDLCRDFREKLKELFEYTRNFYGLSQREFGPLIGMGKGATYYRWLNSNYNLINARYIIQFCLVFSVDITTAINTKYGDERLPTVQFLKAYTDFHFIQDSQKPAFYSLVKSSIQNQTEKKDLLAENESAIQSPETNDTDSLPPQNEQLNASRAEVKKILQERKEAASKICDGLENLLLDIFEITRIFYALSGFEFSDLISSPGANPFIQFKIFYRNGHVQMFNAEFIIRFALIFDIDLNTIISTLVEWQTRKKLPENFYKAYSSFSAIPTQKAKERFAATILNESLPTDKIIASYQRRDSFKKICKEYDVDTATVRAIIAKAKRANSSLQRVKKTRISDEKKQQVVEMNENGVFPQAIAKELGISISSVYVILHNKSETKPTFERGRMTKEKLAKFHDLLVSDKPLKEVAEQTGFSQATVSKYRKMLREQDDSKTNTQS